MEVLHETYSNTQCIILQFFSCSHLFLDLEHVINLLARHIYLLDVTSNYKLLRNIEFAHSYIIVNIYSLIDLFKKVKTVMRPLTFNAFAAPI